MRKVLRLIPLLFAFLLTGCGKVDYSGIYEFRLGKTNGTHFSLICELSDTMADDNSGKKFRLDFDSSFNESESSEEENSVDSNQKSVLADDDLDAGSPDDISLPFEEGIELYIEGSYNIVDKEIIKNEKKIIRHVLDLQITNFAGYDFSSILPPDFDWKTLFLATVDNNQIMIRVPVSTEDLKKQVEWINAGHDAADDVPVPSKDSSSDSYFHTVTISLIKK